MFPFDFDFFMIINGVSAQFDRQWLERLGNTISNDHLEMLLQITPGPVIESQTKAAF